jgi:hypothetical protein
MESARRGPRCAFKFVELCETTCSIRIPPNRCKQLVRPQSSSNTASSLPFICVPVTSRGTVIKVRVGVLKGGADLWIRRFYQDASMVTGFDDEFWGWGEQFDCIHNVNGSMPANTDPTHSLYSRPGNQMATEWSAAGHSRHPFGGEATAIVTATDPDPN